MSKFVDQIIQNDFVYDAILNALPNRRRKSHTGFININCPVCQSRGHKPDKRRRCGIKREFDRIGISCFNCGFKTIWKRGQGLGKKIKEFLEALGVSENEVKKLNYRILTQRNFIVRNQENIDITIPQRPYFNEVELPKGSKSIEEWVLEDCLDQNFLDCIEYLYTDRGSEIAESYTYFWSPENDLNRRIIIPYYDYEKIVGYTSRKIDNDSSAEKYLNQSQKDYLFNPKALENYTRKYIILVEGIFDAIAIDGVGLCGTHLNKNQIAWIKESGKQIIYVPDRDLSGIKIIDTIIEQNWSVSFPYGTNGNQYWDNSVKDVAQAVKKYGKLWVILSIINTAVSDKNKIKVLTKKLINDISKN